MYTFIKNRAGLLAIRRNKRLYRRTRKVYNLKDAQSIGIVFEATRKEDFEAVLDFYQKISTPGKTIQVIGYVHAKEIPAAYLFKKDFFLFDRKMTNWFDKPKDEDVQRFVRTPFHILLNLSMKSRNCLRYITASCPASFKVGCNLIEKNDFDLVINLEKSADLGYFIKQTNHYMEIINRPDLATSIMQ